MKTLAIIYTLISISFQLSAQGNSPYNLFKENGRKICYKQMIKQLSKADIILFGELHNNSICHWLELEVSKSLSESNKMVFGAEMFESRDQTALNLYLADSIDSDSLKSIARLWPNFKTDNKPLTDLAKETNSPFIATNVPRIYASMVYRGGWETLDTISQEEKQWIAPLPVQYDPELLGYKAMLEMGGGHGGENLPKAQAIKDATMAYFILQNMPADGIFLHYNGAYHSDNYEGIGWYLDQSGRELKIMTITTVVQEDVRKLEKDNSGKAHFTICVDSDVTNTY